MSAVLSYEVKAYRVSDELVSERADLFFLSDFLVVQRRFWSIFDTGLLAQI